MRGKGLPFQSRRGVLTAANLIGGLLFGGIGFVAFVYGKKQTNLKALLIGIILMVYPYFVSNVILLYVIGTVLTVCLFIFPG